MGTPTDVIFIPPHLVPEVVETAVNVGLRDKFGKYCLSIGKYTPGEIDVPNWPAHIEADYQIWLEARKRA